MLQKIFHAAPEYGCGFVTYSALEPAGDNCPCNKKHMSRTPPLLRNLQLHALLQERVQSPCCGEVSTAKSSVAPAQWVVL